VYLISALAKEGAKIQAYDPAGMTRARLELQQEISSKNLTLLDDPYLALEGADALVVLTEWQKFRSPTFSKIKKAMRGTHLLDGRLLYEPRLVEREGLTYHGVGVPEKNSMSALKETYASARVH
jgi:UDPglucose 6-dehydrogenase